MKKYNVREYLENRWERIDKMKNLELRNTSVNTRFIQTSALMEFANSLNFKKNMKEQNNIRRAWKNLREKGS
ncbi:MAG: hypothetical protein M1501_01845 [Candidatus Omnitrophica bacterium]|nr:hypothetical protein [Candidatus Omnitrophota bacterium]